MRQLRFIFIALITSVFVTSAVFLRKAIAVLLCGVLSFNSGSCYSLLGDYGKADAAAPPSSAVVTSKDFSVVQEDDQKVAGCLFGVCVDLPKLPGVPVPKIPIPNIPVPKIPASIPTVPNGNSNGQSSANECQLSQADKCDADSQSKPVDLTGIWLTKGSNGTLSQQGCTQGYNGEVFVDSKDNAQGIDVKVTQTGNRLIIPDQVIGGTHSESYTVTTQGRVCGNKIQTVSCGNTSLGRVTNLAKGTISDDGNTVTGESLCKFTGGPATYTAPFTWTRKAESNISFYKLSAYKIEVGSNGVGVVTTPVDTVVAQFATKPDSKTIYTDGTSNSLNYVLDGIATAEDIQELKKKVLSVSETAQSILDNTLQIFKDSIPTDSGKDIKAEFHPKGKTIVFVSLGSLAKALGYESFNWLQIVSQEPSNAVVYDGFDQLIVDRGKILRPTRIFYQPQPKDNTFYDPLPGGNDIRIVSYVEEGSSLIRSTFIGLDLLIAKGIALLTLSKMYAADTQPFYYDIPGFADGNLKGRLNAEEFPSVLDKISKDGQSLTFFDRPESYNIPDGDFTLFKTSLVGLKSATGNQYELIPNYTFTWKSNYDSCHRGTPFPPYPGCSKGGSTTLISK